MSSAHDSKRLVVILAIMAIIAAAHIAGIGRSAPQGLYNLYYSYFSDLTIPFGFYFLLGLPGNPILVRKSWIPKLAIAFLTPSIAETCQYLGIPLLGSTFDPLDYLAYGIGTSSAAIVDTQIFARVLKFWTFDISGRKTFPGS